MLYYDDGIKQLVDRYLSRYNLNTETLDYYIKNVLVNHSRLYKTIIDGIEFSFLDSVTSSTVALVTHEINNGSSYNFKEIDFKEGDVVIDIGGNVGMVSIYLAKKFPFLKIYAFEPLKQNYEHFVQNIQLNNIPKDTIILKNEAVTCDGRKIDMSINALNLGGSSISDVISVGAIKQECNCGINSDTLANIMESNNISNLKLLKIDCEGSEYEILYKTSPEYLKRIEMIRGEFHENKSITSEYDIDKLINYISQFVSDIDVVKARGCFIM